MKHTHRGTCQACGRPTAMQLRNNLIAKHGYTVEWGFFNGICVGSDNKPLEQDKQITLQIIKQLREVVAVQADKRAADLQSGAVEPRWFKSVYKGGKFEKIDVKRDELPSYEQKQILTAAIYNAESKARGARSHAAMLEQLIESRHGKALIPVIAKRELSVGDRVQLGGKKGVICEVVELKMQAARGCGPYMNGHVMLHAILKREGKDALIAVPTRTIRQSSIIEGGAQ